MIRKLNTNKCISILHVCAFLFLINQVKAQLSYTVGQTIDDIYYNVTIGDVDGDKDIDIVTKKIWSNDGYGNFTISDSISPSGNDLQLADLDNDGDLDAFIAKGGYSVGKPCEVWFNNGKGHFTNSGQQLGNRYSWRVALGDLDGDGDIDAFVCNHAFDTNTQGGHQVWLNDGKGIFTNSGQDLGNGYHLAVRLGDIDGDGDLDAMVSSNSNWANGINENEIWLNDGKANFTKKVLSKPFSNDLSVADIDKDGDLDIVIGYMNFGGNSNIGAKLFLNDGKGNFTASAQTFDNAQYFGVDIGDINNDGNNDIMFANGNYMSDVPNKTWLGNGNGTFTKSDFSFGNKDGILIKLADFNNDNKLDAIVGNKIWINTTLTSSSKIEEKKPLNQKFKIISNPETGQYSLSFGNTPIKQAIIELYTISGSLVLSKTVCNTISTTIDLFGFQKGIYIINVLADGELAKTKFSIE